MLTVPGTTQAPVIANKGSSWITLSWTSSSNSGGLPLIQFVIQKSTNKQTWEDLKTVPHIYGQSVGASTTAGQWVGNVTGLAAYSGYYYRVLAENVLGRGPGLASQRVFTLAAGRLKYLLLLVFALLFKITCQTVNFWFSDIHPLKKDVNY